MDPLYPDKSFKLSCKISYGDDLKTPISIPNCPYWLSPNNSILPLLSKIPDVFPPAYIESA